MKKLITITSLALLIAGLLGCPNKAVVAVHPGAISNIDSYSYDILLIEQEVIGTARQQYLDGKLPPVALDFLRGAISQYNVSQAAWQAYHNNHDPALGSKLQDAINALVGAVGQLQQVLGKAPAPVPSGMGPHTPASPAFGWGRVGPIPQMEGA